MVPQPASESNGRGTIDGSDMSAHVSVTPDGFSVTGSERLRYDFVFVENVFDPANDQVLLIILSAVRSLLIVCARPACGALPPVEALPARHRCDRARVLRR